MIDILTNFGLGLLGMLLYTLFKAKDYVFNNEFVLSTLLLENWKAWVWSALVLLTMVIVLNLEPSLKEPLKAVFGVDLDASPGGFFMFGATINLLLKPTGSKTKRKSSNN